MAGTLTISTLSDGTNSTSSTNCIQGSAKAWVNWNGTNGSVRTSYNVSSVTRSSAGIYAVNFTNAFSDANYAINVSLSGVQVVSYAKAISLHMANATEVLPTSSSFTLTTWNWNTSPGDSSYVYASCFR